MIKKCLFLFSAFCVLSNSFMLSAAEVPTNSSNDSVATSVLADPGTSIDSIAISSTRMTITSNAPKKIFYGSSEYILSEGKAYKITSAERGEFLSGEFNDTFENRSKRDIEHQIAEHVVPLVLIVFGIPAFLIIMIIGVLMYFLLKRNKAKNNLIAKAIDNNYQLPESFYTQQPAASPSQQSPETDCNEPNSRLFASIPMAQRDSAKFTRAISLICIGIPLFFFLAINENYSVALLFGGVLICLGVGQLISYYSIPAQPRTNRPSQNPSQSPRYTNRPPCPPPTPNNRTDYRQ